MSLLRIRRERREGMPGPNRPPALWKLFVAMVIVGFILWYLGQIG